ncbi:MAG: Ig-like domain-containing protein [bacterium]
MKSEKNRVYFSFVILLTICFFLLACGGTSKDSKDNQTSVIITSPIDGSTVSGTVFIIAEARDNENISKATLYVDGTLVIGSEDYMEPFEFQWDTMSYENLSTHTITVRAFDADNTIIDSDTIILIVDNIGGYPPNLERTGTFPLSLFAD